MAHRHGIGGGGGNRNERRVGDGAGGNLAATPYAGSAQSGCLGRSQQRALSGIAVVLQSVSQVSVSALPHPCQPLDHFGFVVYRITSFCGYTGRGWSYVSYLSEGGHHQQDNSPQKKGFYETVLHMPLFDRKTVFEQSASKVCHLNKKTESNRIVLYLNEYNLAVAFRESLNIAGTVM